MWIVLGLLALPLVEIGLFVTLGAKLGLWLTLGWVVLTGVLGVLLLKSMALAGGETLRRGFREGLQDPLSPLAHRALVGVAAVLLILPGFFTDALGLVLLLPPVSLVCRGPGILSMLFWGSMVLGGLSLGRRWTSTSAGVRGSPVWGGR